MESKFSKMNLDDEYSRRISNNKFNLVNCNLKVMDKALLPASNDQEYIDDIKHDFVEKNLFKKANFLKNFENLKETKSREHFIEKDYFANLNDDDFENDQNNLNEMIQQNDYMEMAIHYKNLCKVCSNK